MGQAGRWLFTRGQRRSLGRLRQLPARRKVNMTRESGTDGEVKAGPGVIGQQVLLLKRVGARQGSGWAGLAAAAGGRAAGGAARAPAWPVHPSLLHAVTAWWCRAQGRPLGSAATAAGSTCTQQQRQVGGRGRGAAQHGAHSARARAVGAAACGGHRPCTRQAARRQAGRQESRAGAGCAHISAYSFWAEVTMAMPRERDCEEEDTAGRVGMAHAAGSGSAA